MLIEQYNSYEPEQLPGQKVNGALTIGENIGDLGGLSIAYKAYRGRCKGQDPPVIDGLTGDQRFFIGWALAWRSQVSATPSWPAGSPPIPIRRRSSGATASLRNIPEFYSAFGVKEGDKLWLRARAARADLVSLRNMPTDAPDSGDPSRALPSPGRPAVKTPPGAVSGSPDNWLADLLNPAAIERGEEDTHPTEPRATPAAGHECGQHCAVARPGSIRRTSVAIR